MSIQKSKRTSSRTRSVPRNCCDDKCPAGSRNNYFLGKRLTPDSYKLEQDYANGRRRLLNRAIHGWGVVYGFALAAGGAGHAGGNSLEPGELKIGEGLALDRSGRELIQVGNIVLTLDNLLILDGKGDPVRVDGRDLDDRLDGLTENVEDCWLLTAHYAEQGIDPVPLKDPCCDDRTEWDRTCETIVYSLSPIDCADCCKPWQCELRCDCPPARGCCAEDGWAKYESDRSEVMNAYEQGLEGLPDREPVEVARLQLQFEDRFANLAKQRIELAQKTHPRGGCACLCDHLTGLKLGDDRARLSDVGDCTHADLANGVDLACLRLARDSCGDWTIGAIVDACGPRRLVKRNDLLFDLINGCDVTRIVEVGWAAWHRREQPVPFEAFAAALGWDGPSDYEEYPTRDFWVRFSRKVRADTLTAEVFAMAVMSDQAEGRWRDYYRVPILAVETSPPEPEDGLVDRARIVVSGAWLRDGVMGDGSIFREGETRVEIEVRGDLVQDCLGQTVDANPRGWSPAPSGTDGPGDSYLSAFMVATRIPQAPRETRPAAGRRRPLTES